MTYLISVIGGMVIAMFVLPRFANSTAGIGIVFLITGLLGFGLGPILSMYASLPNGSNIITLSLAGTGVIFMGLSAYALATRKDFSFLGGFLMVGFLLILLAALANIFFANPSYVIDDFGSSYFGYEWIYFVRYQPHHSWRRNKLYFGNYRPIYDDF